MPGDDTTQADANNVLGDVPCAQCGATTPTTPWHLDPSTGFMEFAYYLCAWCALTEESRDRPSTHLMAQEAFGLTGLPDPEGLPSVLQITDLDQPSDTELPD